MNPVQAKYTPFGSGIPLFSEEENCVECPLKERDLIRSSMENTPNQTTESELMKKIQQIHFAMVDINLFLDTHPDCEEALKLYTELASTLKSLKSDYVANYGPLVASDSSNQVPFEWVQTGRKWPWQK